MGNAPRGRYGGAAARRPAAGPPARRDARSARAEELAALAVKTRISRQVAAGMSRAGLSKRALARRMRTSRAALDRLLDPAHPSLTLATLVKAAGALDLRLRVDLRPSDAGAPPDDRP